MDETNNHDDQIIELKFNEKTGEMNLDIPKKPGRPVTSAEELARRRIDRKKEVDAAKRKLMGEDPEAFESTLDKQQSITKKQWELKPLISGGILGFKPHVMQTDKNDSQIILAENNNREVEHVSDDYMINAILRYSNTVSESDKYMKWNYDLASQAFKIWRTSKTIPEPKLFAWKSEKELTFKRMSFDPEKKDHYEHPTWNELLDRIENNRDQFIDYIGSIFINESHTHNYLWLYGEGGNGKGSLLRALHDALVNSAVKLTVPDNSERRFWLMQLIGKRLGYFPDCNNYGFVRTGFFKELTGGDYIRVEMKNKGFVHLKNNMKFIFASNTEPEISGGESDTRRIIYCRMGKPHKLDPNFERHLAAEMPEFIKFCVAHYLDNYAERGFPAIRADSSDLVESCEETFQSIVDTHFEIGEHHSVSAKDFVTELNTLFKKNKLEIFDFKRFLNRKYGISMRAECLKQNNNVFKIYRKIKIKSRYSM